MTEAAVGPPLSSMPPMIDVVGLTVRTAGLMLLDRVSLTLAPGRVLAITGRNGAGKTTLLRALLGEVEFTGSIRRRASTLGYVPQRLEFDRTLALTTEEFLALSRQRRPVCLGVTAAARAHIATLLAAAGLSDCARRPVAELSGGELRRLVFAHALDPRPQLLLLDEPTEALDRASVLRFEEHVRELRAAGTGIVLVSHDRALIDRLADEMVSLDRDDGAPAERAA